MTAIDIALAWRRVGVAAIPVVNMQKIPACKWDCYNPLNKHSSLPSVGIIKSWWASPGYGMAVVAGWNGLTIADFDSMWAYSRWLSCLAGRQLRSVMLTYKVVTARGIHIYFWSTDEEYLGNHSLDGIDIKSGGALANHPPSIHPSGFEYYSVGRIENIQHVHIADIFDIKSRDRLQGNSVVVYDKFDIPQTGERTNYIAKVIDDEIAILESSAIGSRNRALNRAAYKLGQLVGAGLVDEQNIFSKLLTSACNIGLVNLEAKRTIISGMRSGKKNPRRLQ